MTNVGQLVDYELPSFVGWNEYIHSFLVDYPGCYYMVGNRTYLYYLDRRYGLMEFHSDFTAMSHQDVVDYIVGALELITNAIEEGEPNND